MRKSPLKDEDASFSSLYSKDDVAVTKTTIKYLFK